METGRRGFPGWGGGGGGAAAAAAAEEPPEVRAEVRLIVLEWIGNDPRESRELERSLRDNIKRLEPCWKREARKGHSVIGELILPMSVSANGEGRTIKEPVSDSIANPKLLECLQDKLQANLFPAGLGTLDVELTLTLSEEAR